MNANVFCRTVGDGVLSSFLLAGEDEYYLFSEAYRSSVREYYKGGVDIERALDFSRTKRTVKSNNGTVCSARSDYREKDRPHNFPQIRKKTAHQLQGTSAGRSIFRKNSRIGELGTS